MLSTVAQQLCPVVVSICPEDGIISDCCFAEAQAFVYEVMEKRFVI